MAAVQLRNGPKRLQWLQYNLGMVQRGEAAVATVQLRNGSREAAVTVIEIRDIPEVAVLLYS